MKLEIKIKPYIPGLIQFNTSIIIRKSLLSEAKYVNQDYADIANIVLIKARPELHHLRKLSQI